MNKAAYNLGRLMAVKRATDLPFQHSINAMLTRELPYNQTGTYRGGLSHGRALDAAVPDAFRDGANAILPLNPFEANMRTGRNSQGTVVPRVTPSGLDPSRNVDYGQTAAQQQFRATVGARNQQRAIDARTANPELYARAEAAAGPLDRVGRGNARQVVLDQGSLGGLRRGGGNVSMYAQRAPSSMYGTHAAGSTPTSPSAPRTPARNVQPVQGSQLTDTFAGKRNPSGIKIPNGIRKHAAYEIGVKQANLAWELAKGVPFVGAVPSFWDAGKELFKGNFGRAAIEGGLGALSLVPGAGFGASAARAGMGIARGAKAVAGGVRGLGGGLNALGHGATGVASASRIGQGARVMGRHAAKGLGTAFSESAATAPLLFRGSTGLRRLGASAMSSPLALGMIARDAIPERQPAPTGAINQFLYGSRGVARPLPNY